MVTRLIVAGDSNSFGAEAIGDFSYSETNHSFAFGAYVAKHYNLQYKNIAKNGASNIDIANNVLNEAEKNTDSSTFFLIGWTEAYRLALNNNNFHINKGGATAYFLNKKISNDSITQNYSNRLKKFDPLKEFVRIYLGDLINTNELLLSSILPMLAVDLFLRQNNIPYLAFCTLELDFPKKLLFYKELFSKRNNIFHNDRVKVFNSDHYFNYIDIFKKHGCMRGGHHLDAKAHKACGEWLVQQIKEREILIAS